MALCSVPAADVLHVAPSHAAESAAFVSTALFARLLLTTLRACALCAGRGKLVPR